MEQTRVEQRRDICGSFPAVIFAQNLHVTSDNTNSNFAFDFYFASQTGFIVDLYCSKSGPPWRNYAESKGVAVGDLLLEKGLDLDEDLEQQVQMTLEALVIRDILMLIGLESCSAKSASFPIKGDQRTRDCHSSLARPTTKISQALTSNVVEKHSRLQ